jgi:hypothetical protein
MTSDVFLVASALDVIGLVVQSLTAIAAVALAYIALRIAAKPGIRVDVDRDGGPCIFTPGEAAVLSIHVDLRGYFYGKPTASDTKITVNVEQPWGLKLLSWSAPGESETGQSENRGVARGKGLRSSPWWHFWDKVPTTKPSNFLVADRLWLTRDEKRETLYATVVAPDSLCRQVGWIHATAREGDCGVHTFSLECR